MLVAGRQCCRWRVIALGWWWQVVHGGGWFVVAGGTFVLMPPVLSRLIFLRPSGPVTLRDIETAKL